MVQLLLQARADPTLLDRYGNSLLHLALQTGNEEMLRTLLTHLGSAAPYLLRLPSFRGECGSGVMGRTLVCHHGLGQKAAEPIPILQASCLCIWL